MSIVLHLRDHRIQVLNFQPDVQTSVFPGLLRSELLNHLDLPTYDASCVDQDAAERSGLRHVFFVHTPDQAPWVAKLANEMKGHVVFASTLGVNAVPAGAPPDRCHPCYWKPADFVVPPPRLKRWLEQLKGGDIAVVDWSLLHPIAPESLHAVKILCQGFQLASDPKYSRVVNLPTDWTTLFGSDLESTLKDVPDDAKQAIILFLRSSTKSADDVAKALAVVEKAIHALNN